MALTIEQLAKQNAFNAGMTRTMTVSEAEHAAWVRKETLAKKMNAFMTGQNMTVTELYECPAVREAFKTIEQFREYLEYYYA